MSGGLAALLDDIAALARAAAASVDDVAAAAGKASVKATGIVVDDTAVVPQYMQGIRPERELPMIWRIAKGSLFNKLVIILPVAMLLSQFAPILLTPILMLGGTFLAFEGAEKVWELITGKGHDTEESNPDRQVEGQQDEDTIVKNAIRTDIILSAEIMVLSLNDVADRTFWMRLAVMIVIALFMTVMVYGVVALIVKLDDVGLRMMRREGGSKLGELLVKAMPIVLAILQYVGMVAMLWVGGHILLQGTHDLGWTTPFDLVHTAEHWVSGLVPAAIAPVVGWITETFISAIVGFVVGSIVAGIVSLFHRDHGDTDRDGQPRDAQPSRAASARETTRTDHSNASGSTAITAQ